MAALQVRTWADHLEPIGYGTAIPVRSSDSMNREYPLNTGDPAYSYWWTAEDGSLFFYPFGRATGIYDASSYTPQGYHFMWVNDYPDPAVVFPFVSDFVFGLFYMDDKDMNEMVGQTVNTNVDNLVITADAQMAPPFYGTGQVIPPFPFSFGLITSVGKLAEVT